MRVQLREGYRSHTFFLYEIREPSLPYYLHMCLLGYTHNNVQLLISGPLHFRGMMNLFTINICCKRLYAFINPRCAAHARRGLIINELKISRHALFAATCLLTFSILDTPLTSDIFRSASNLVSLKAIIFSAFSGGCRPHKNRERFAHIGHTTIYLLPTAMAQL